MFIQVIQGRLRDEEKMRTLTDRWQAQLAPGAEGWLGSTYGLTDDGTFVGVVRFESEDAARHNSRRPEQDAWWQEAERCFQGDVEFHDCTDVTTLLEGGSDDAGFVQVIQGRAKDRQRLHEMVDQSREMMTQERPDIIGATLAIDADGAVTETVAFTTEEEAREGERRELSEESRRLFEEEMSQIEDIRYLDLHSPWFASPR
jgi:hypothetical protein